MYTIISFYLDARIRTYTLYYSQLIIIVAKLNYATLILYYSRDLYSVILIRIYIQ